MLDTGEKIQEPETEDLFKCPNKPVKENTPDFSGIKLRLNFGLELFNSKMKSNKDSTSKSFTVSLMSPTTMKNELLKLEKKLEKENKKIDVDNFKFNHKRLFWNLLWYLQLNDMEISFMLPYSSELQTENETFSNMLSKLPS